MCFSVFPVTVSAETSVKWARYRGRWGQRFRKTHLRKRNGTLSSTIWKLLANTIENSGCKSWWTALRDECVRDSEIFEFKPRAKAWRNIDRRSKRWWRETNKNTRLRSVSFLSLDSFYTSRKKKEKENATYLNFLYMQSITAENWFV